MGSLMNSPLSCRDFRWRSSPRVFNDCSSVVKFPRCICSTIEQLLKGSIETITVCTEKELRQRRLRSDLRKRSKAGGKAALCVPPTPSAFMLLLDPCHFYFGPETVSSFIFRTRCRWSIRMSEPFVGQNDTIVWQKYTNQSDSRT